jgi:aldehyde dehydrogenase (NAD+)
MSMTTDTSNNWHKFYINGTWTEPKGTATLEIINPATETACATVALGDAKDIDAAVRAAYRAFPTFSRTSKADRVALLERVLSSYIHHAEAMAQAVTAEMGAPLAFSRGDQVAGGRAHLETTIEFLKKFEFEIQRGKTQIFHEPVGVAGLITPWNWPLVQIVCKVAPALGAGCTVVLKPSELAPLSALVFAQVMHDADLPPGVFNLVNGDGPGAGEALARNPLVDMVSFTGSTRGGIAVAKTAADTVKRVSQELGGKSANILLDDADFATAVRIGIKKCFDNSGQSCDAPTRMLVPEAALPRVRALAKEAAAAYVVGDPLSPSTVLGPLANKSQFHKVQRLIQAGISEGAEVLTGGIGRPDGLTHGYYVRPTIFSGVTPAMTVAREEIFGPVLSILTYRSEEEAIEIANDTPYGLAGRVQSGDINRARAVASRLRAGTININYSAWDITAPFGGFKQSGNGREYADFGIKEFVEIKAVVGYRT